MAGEEKLNRAMGKLVLFLADGTTLDIPLDHERVTVGRRATNDVCLPYAAVSGAHAVFVTAATGVVVEDLGSTNGTTVNGTRATRHVLHDGDRIDIGRQRFVFLADVNAAVPVPAPRKSAGRRAGDERGGNEAGGEPRVGDTIVSATRSSDVARAAAPPPIDPSTAPAKTAESWLSAPGPSGSPGAGNPAARLRNGSAPNAIATEESMSAFAAPAPAFVGPILRVLTGPSAGRTLMVTRNEALIGRVGTQVAAIRKADEEFRRR